MNSKQFKFFKSILFFVLSSSIKLKFDHQLPRSTDTIIVINVLAHEFSQTQLNVIMGKI